MSESEKTIKYLQEQLDSQQAMFIQTNNYLAQVKGELEMQVQARTKELADANHELITLLYRTSHDFKSPVASLKGLLNIIRSFSSDPIFNIAIQNGFETLKKQENMFLNLNHYHLIKDEKLTGENVPVYAMANKVLDDMEKTFTNIKTVTQIDIGNELFFFTAPDLLRIVLYSLVENAYIFSKGNHINITARLESNFLTVSISDKGDGIAASSADNIYEMFYRGSVLSQGNGLGLFIVKSAITKLGGEIKFKSLAGVGTNFTFKIPGLL